MSQEMGLLTVFDCNRLKEPPTLWVLILKWTLYVPRVIVLSFLALSFLTTSVLSHICIMLTARFPQSRFDFNTHLSHWTWRIGFYSLEEFINQNWSDIDWGSSIEIYKSNKHDGRGFPAGDWNIDFLARDTITNDLVVIQLKRGESSDATVGQLMRYTSWIKEKVAEPNQKVRGIIVAKQVDTALQYAIRNLPLVEVKTYDVGFHIRLKPTNISAPLENIEKQLMTA